jgi:hypothetical protein
MWKHVSWKVGLVACAVVGAAAPASAQDLVDPIPSPARQLDGTRLRPATLTYVATIRRDDSTRVVGDRSVAITEMLHFGFPAWQIVESTSAPQPYALADTTIVERATLRLLHWGSYVDFTRVVADFRSDSIFGGITTPVGRRTMVGDLPATAWITAAQTEAAISVYPLIPDLRDSVTIVATETSRSTTLRAELAVLGEERVTVPAGSYDCWIVTLTTDAGGPTYWVAKRDGVIVRSLRMLPENGGMLVYDLAKLSR